MTLEDALVSLGKQLEESGWHDPEMDLTLFDLGDDEKETKYKAKAILFLKSIETALRKLLCTEDGKVRASVKAMPDIIAICTKVLTEKDGVNIEPQVLADVLIHTSLETFCSYNPT